MKRYEYDVIVLGDLNRVEDVMALQERLSNLGGRGFRVIFKYQGHAVVEREVLAAQV